MSCALPEGYENCWEYWKCAEEVKDKCPVYLSDDGKKCWLYMDKLKTYEWARPKQMVKSCEACDWYKASNAVA